MRLSALVVTFNRSAHLRLTVQRLLDEGADHVLVVDNASTDDTQEVLTELDDPRLEVIRLQSNTGGAGGFEAGLRHIRDVTDPDWVVVMDDDGRPSSGALNAFRNADLSGWDAVASAVYYPDGRICDMNRPGRNPFWHMKTMVKTSLGLLYGGSRDGYHLGAKDYAATSTAQPIDYASFVGLFLSRDAIHRAGLPDGDLFIYGDDTLYTLRLARAGGKIGFLPEIKYEHDCSTLGADETRRYTPIWKSYYIHRNVLTMYRYAAGPWFVVICPLLLLKWGLNARHYDKDRGLYIRLLRRGIWDAARGQRGKLSGDLAQAAGQP